MVSSSENTRYFSRDDLLIMLETYKNTIEPLTLILEQNKQILEKYTQLGISLTNIGTSIQETTNRLGTCSVEIQKLVSSLNTVLEKQDGSRKTEFESLKHRINLLYVVNGSIVLALIGLVASIIKG